jgi:hypothetical protein
MAANVSIVTPISPSSTCQALGRANQGANQRAPKPSAANHIALALLAPAMNQGCSEFGC